LQKPLAAASFSEMSMDLPDLPDNWKEILLWWKRRKEIHVEWRVGPVGNSKSSPTPGFRNYIRKKEENATMALIMTATQECPLEVAFKDSRGNPAAVENIVWGSSDEGIVKVNPNDAEPNKAIALSVAVGTAQVNVKADARVGTGTNEIVGLLVVEILAAEATVVEISAGTPIETPHVEPFTPTRRK
jgi:hypothetical protein